ncbi:DUF6768 family protein [Frigidibacter sp. SD6-1]|uniref:DUF6768 family protein n=1 Tax=Frigidibacter sp. SD6-1 TaxID=3032581 RepID=UPI0024E01159|nr:DUF6768 family protein [Frigidibacter sp. SD6-1]
MTKEHDRANEARMTELLGEEDRALTAEFEERPFVAEAFGLFSGRNGWVAAVTMASQIAMFLAAVWCGWHFFRETDLLAALKWGLSGATLLILATVVKMALLPMMQANRILRALRALEGLARH